MTYTMGDMSSETSLHMNIPRRDLGVHRASCNK